MQNLEIILLEYAYDCIIICETWLCNQKISNAKLSYKSKYSVFRRDRENRSGGGVCILVKSCFQVNQIEVLHLQSHTFRIINVYRAPNLNFDSTKSYGTKLVDLSLVSYPTIICGDFNFPNIDWINETVSANSNNFSTQCWFLKVMLDSNFAQFVTQPTRYNSILDLVLCNNINVIGKCEVIAPFGWSDHNSISLIIKVPILNSNYHLRRNYKKAKFGKINSILANINWQTLFYERSVNEMTMCFLEIFSDLIRRYIPLKRQKYTPLSSDYLISLRKQKLKLWRLPAKL